MREIKFRAWNGSEMRYKVNVNDGKPVRYWYQWFDDSNDIYDSELMQYIWIKDKNGKEIYEGDLVECIAEKAYERDSWVYPIEYFVDEQRFALKWVCHLWWGWWTSIEVVGNIYENPELIKV